MGQKKTVSLNHTNGNTLICISGTYIGRPNYYLRKYNTNHFLLKFIFSLGDQ